jgi:hypothetical protein
MGNHSSFIAARRNTIPDEFHQALSAHISPQFSLQAPETSLALAQAMAYTAQKEIRKMS